MLDSAKMKWRCYSGQMSFAAIVFSIAFFAAYGRVPTNLALVFFLGGFGFGVVALPLSLFGLNKNVPKGRPVAFFALVISSLYLILLIGGFFFPALAE
jgi:hypothetical protein